MKVESNNGVLSVSGVVSYEGFKINVYQFLVDGMLIDTGAYRLLNKLIPFYNENTIDMVCLTHDHEDHNGTAAWLQHNKQVPIYIHANSVENCLKEANYPDYRKRMWGVRESFEAHPYGGAVIQSNNYSWEIIHTPGHEENHISLLNQEKGILFSGDLFVAQKTRIIMESESIPETMASIRKLLNYDFTEMYCSHSGYHQDGRKKLKLKLNYLEELSGEIADLYGSGKTIEEIDKELFPKVPPLTYISDHQWDSKHIIRSILGSEVKSV